MRRKRICDRWCGGRSRTSVTCSHHTAERSECHSPHHHTPDKSHPLFVFLPPCTLFPNPSYPPHFRVVPPVGASAGPKNRRPLPEEVQQARASADGLGTPANLTWPQNNCHSRVTPPPPHFPSSFSSAPLDSHLWRWVTHG